jgi:putative nucleotidyltransferase with HDIG domain
MDLNSLRTELQAIDTFKSPPSLLQEILAVTEDPRSGAKDVQAMVERDMSCSVKLLKLANSAYYGFSRQIKTIREAIVIIGLDGVKNVVMSLGIADAFTKGTPTERVFQSNLWVHSMATATASSVLSKSLTSVSPSVAYCAGLLHDFGKVIMSQYFGTAYEKVVITARDEKLSIMSVERNLLGVDHAHVGSWIAEAWDLPEVVTEILRDHHSNGPWEEAKKYIPLVGIANALAYESRVGHGGNYRPHRYDDYCYSSMQLEDSLVQAVIAEIRKESSRYSAMLHLD